MADIKGTKTSEFTETINPGLEDYLPLIQDGTNKKVKVKYIKGASNLTDEYVELLDDAGEKYRARINDKGEFVAQKAIAYTAEDPDPADNRNLFQGLIINQIYGGGQALVNTSVSHSFVELYNMTAEEINLKGLYLFYKPKSGDWQSLALQGIVPPYHSFLIRGGEHNSIYKEFVRCKITDYDQLWMVDGQGIKFSNAGFSIYLAIGSNDPGNPIRSTTDLQGIVTYSPRYIDLLAAGGTEQTDTVASYEVDYNFGMSVDCACRRIDFYNGSSALDISGYNNGKGNNKKDSEIVNYKTCNVEGYRPRSLKDGQWNIYVNKTKLNERIPNLVNIGYGENGETSRTFTWQSIVTENGELKYRKVGNDTWLTVESKKKLVRHTDCDVTVHSVIIHDLEVGKYEYQVGEEGAWSDVAVFEVKKYSESDTIKMLWTTDQQGWTENEYNAWKTVMKNILDWYPDYDFHLNTGDISQNANRSFEWRWYFQDLLKTNKVKPNMFTCGNNDLESKKYSDAYNNYVTEENQKWNSVHFWDLGFTHFVCLNSNTDYTYVNNDGSEGGFENTDAFLQAQCDWLDTHLQEVTSRETAPRWIVIYMHLSPFTIVRTKRLQRFIPVFEKYKIPLVLCGHNHTHSRSKALYTGYNGTDAYNDYVTKVSGSSDLKIVEETINKEENLHDGTHYVMINASGYKLTGKEKAIKLPDNLKGGVHDNGSGQPWWYAAQNSTQNPNYATVEISYDTIKIEMNFVQGVLTTDTQKNVTVNDYGTQTKYMFDSLTINHSDRE